MNEEYCLDADGSDTYWSPLPTDSCGFNNYDELYEGPAIKLITAEYSKGPTLYTVTTQDVTFALTRTNDFSLCGYTLTRTEHPKLFLLEITSGRIFKSKTKLL